VVQVYVFKTTCTKENYLELFSFRDELREQADFFRLTIIRMWTHLVRFVCPSRNGVARSEVLIVNRVPI